MSYRQPLPPDPKATDAAITLGLYIREERGRCGLRMYLEALGELMPRVWIAELSKRLEVPVPPEPPPFDPNLGLPPLPPPEPRQKKPDMEKILQLMQIMGSMKG